MSPGSRAKMSASHKGVKLSAEHIAAQSRGKVGNGNSLGFQQTEETKLKRSLKLRGPNYGSLMSGQHKQLCRSIYEAAWGPVPRYTNGQAYDIHHRDGDRSNNDLYNLISLTKSEHLRIRLALGRGDVGLVAELEARGATRRKSGGGNGMVG